MTILSTAEKYQALIRLMDLGEVVTCPLTYEELREFSDVLRDLKHKDQLRVSAVTRGSIALVQFSELGRVLFEIKSPPSNWTDHWPDRRVVELDSKKVGFFNFWFDELVQHWGWVLLTFGTSLSLLVCINESTLVGSISDTLTAILAIFLPVFVLFTTAQDQHISRNLALFESGKLYWYFNIDSHLTGAAIALIVGLIFLKGLSVKKWAYALFEVYKRPFQLTHVMYILLSCALCILVLLFLALKEFYLKRSQEYAAGALKDAWFDKERAVSGKAPSHRRAP